MSSPKGYLRMISFLSYVYVTTLILSYVPVLHRSKRRDRERGGRSGERMKKGENKIERKEEREENSMEKDCMKQK